MITYTQMQQLRHELSTMTVSQSSPWDITLFPRGAPYKALMLLSICDAVRYARCPTDLVVLDEWLMQRYTMYVTVCGSSVNDQPVIPFNYLRYEPFWRLVPKQPYTMTEFGDVRSQKAYAQFVAGAKLRVDLYTMLCHAESRGLIRDCLILPYFGVALRDALWYIQER